MMLLKVAVVTCLVAGSWEQNFQCSKDHLDTCLLAISLETHDASISTVDTMTHCRRIRKNMNCIIWYTRNCLSKKTRHYTSDIIRSTRGHLLNFCEYLDRVDENWMDKECFLHHDMEDCKFEFLKQMTGSLQRVDQDTCSRFFLFRQCVDRVFKSSCKEEQTLYLPTYLLDKAEQLSWICIDQDSYYSSVDDRSLSRSLKGAGCLIRNRAKLTRCRSTYQKEKDTETSDSLASACCAFSDYSYCIRQLLLVECDHESRELAENGLQRIKIELGGTCDSYDFRSDECSSSWRNSVYNVCFLVVTTVACFLARSRL